MTRRISGAWLLSDGITTGVKLEKLTLNEPPNSLSPLYYFINASRGFNFLSVIIKPYAITMSSTPPPKRPAAVDEVTEESSLLPQAAPPAYDYSEDDTPLPKTQIFLLCYSRLVEPVAFFTIFPFINQMVWETGDMDEADVGFYTGLIVISPPAAGMYRIE
jgi:hypothetical protein